MGISTPSNASTIDTIRQIHGSIVANELVEFNISNDKWGFQASGWTTNANYHVKRTMLLLFINHRAVESSAIKKAIEQTYSTFLPKGGHPFTYLSLDIDPQRVDVNVHPTKRKVNFLNEDEIIEEICSTVRLKLSQVDTSRTFLTQSLLPHSGKSSLSTPISKSASSKNSTFSSFVPPKPLENALVRTDPSLRKITSMLPPSKPSDSLAVDGPEPVTYLNSPRVATNCRLTTVKDLRASVRDEMHNSLTEIFASHTYVGLVDPMRRIAAIQGGVKLFLVDYGMICNEYFYQLGLTDFGNFGTIKFEPALNVRSLIEMRVGAEKSAHKQAQTDSEGDIEDEELEWEEVADLVTAQLVQRRDMLLEYFAMEISPAGDLVSIPLLLKGYTPPLAKLPRFLMRLGPCVDWNNEKACFDSFLRELAAFYTIEQLPHHEAEGPDGSEKSADAAEDDDDDKQAQDGRGNASGGPAEIRKRAAEVERVLEHVLFPAFRARLIATKGLLRGVVEVADLKGLYRVFERC